MSTNSCSATKKSRFWYPPSTGGWSLVGLSPLPPSWGSLIVHCRSLTLMCGTTRHTGHIAHDLTRLRTHHGQICQQLLAVQHKSSKIRYFQYVAFVSPCKDNRHQWEEKNLFCVFVIVREVDMKLFESLCTQRNHNYCSRCGSNDKKYIFFFLFYPKFYTSHPKSWEEIYECQQTTVEPKSLSPRAPNLSREAKDFGVVTSVKKFPTQRGWSAISGSKDSPSEWGGWGGCVSSISFCFKRMSKKNPLLGWCSKFFFPTQMR